MPKVRYIYWDACVFMHYLERADEIEHLDAVLGEVTGDAGLKIATSTLSQLEVAKIYGEDGLLDDDDAERILEQFWANDSVFEIVELNPYVARLARGLIREATRRGIKGLRANDAGHLATAVYIGAEEIHSYDKKWFNQFEVLVSCPIHKPRAGQFRLPGI